MIFIFLWLRIEFGLGNCYQFQTFLQLASNNLTKLKSLKQKTPHGEYNDTTPTAAATASAAAAAVTVCKKLGQLVRILLMHVPPILDGMSKNWLVLGFENNQEGQTIFPNTSDLYVIFYFIAFLCFRHAKSFFQ